MKKEKLSLKGIKNVLSRDEMKMIMAGSGGGGCAIGGPCPDGFSQNHVPCCNMCAPIPAGNGLFEYVCQ
jgi:hypothetical protein